ncbi:MAG: helix-turn-helix domain-containing protein [Rhodoferax sp.]
MNEPLSITFGQCVRALRQARGLTQVIFSERCGFYQTYLSRIENGQANPTLNAMEVIATGLGLTIFQLFDRVRLSMEPDVTTPEAAPVEVPASSESS